MIYLCSLFYHPSYMIIYEHVSKSILCIIKILVYCNSSSTKLTWKWILYKVQLFHPHEMNILQISRIYFYRCSIITCIYCNSIKLYLNFFYLHTTVRFQYYEYRVYKFHSYEFCLAKKLKHFFSQLYMRPTSRNFKNMRSVICSV